MANYKLLTHASVGSSSEPIFTASATNTVVSSITAKDGSGQTAEVLIQKSGGTVIEMAEVDLTSNAGFNVIDVAFALEAGDKVYIRATRGGMKFIMSYVEEQDLPNDTALGGLADVSTSGVTDGQSLVYSVSSSQWEPATVTGGGGGGASALDDLSDVDITSSTTGDFLKHNGTDYVDTNFDAAVNSNSTVIDNSNKVGYTTALFDADFATKDADDISDTGTNHRFVTAQMQTNLGYLAPITGAIDLDQHESDIADNNLKVTYPSADASKLSLIEDEATANETDANLKNRANHTGSQLSSTISDFTTEVESIIDDQIGNTGDISEGSNLYYTDARVDARIGVAKIEDLDEVSSTAPSIGQVLKWDGNEWAPSADNSSTGGAGGVVDSVNGISQAAVVLDTDDISDATATNKYTTASDITKLSGIDTGATANDTDNTLKDRANHTGQQPSSSISDFGSQVALAITSANLQSLNNVDTPTIGEFLKWNGSTWETDAVSSGGGVVNSVNGISQATVVLDADDIDDSSTTHKFVTAGDVTTLGNITAPSAVNLDTMNSLSTIAFTTANTANGAISSHAGSLRNHSDIDYSEANPANIPSGSVLVWNGNNLWEDKELDLQDLANVNGSPTTGEFLKWDGNDWVTDAPAGGGGTVIQDADTALSLAGDYEAGARLLKLVNTNTTLTSGKVYQLLSSGWDVTTNASEAGSSGLMAVCSSDSTTGSAMITEGVFRARLSLSSASIGDPLYLGTGSEFTLTAPSSSATVVKMGYVLDPSNHMAYFSPDKTTITIQ